MDSQFKRDFKGKLCMRWLGPYIIYKVFDNGIVPLTTIGENKTPMFANGHRLRLYHKPISKDAFISQVTADLYCQLVQEQGSSLVSKTFLSLMQILKKLYINKKI